MITEKQSLIFKKNLSDKLQHLLTGEELSRDEIFSLLAVAGELKKQRKQGKLNTELAGKHLALLFSKPSLRTRFSFTVAMRELGGDVVESVMETRKTEEPEDQIRVLAGYCHAVMVRTHADENLSRMKSVATIPVINGLSDLHHPCQALSDIFTLQENFKNLSGLKLTYIGDGNNVLHSLLLLAPLVGINLHYYCPVNRQPDAQILARAQMRAEQFSAKIVKEQTIHAAAKNAQAIYTDVWVSMGFEDKMTANDFAGFQVNEALMQTADPHAVFMHCLPMERGKEVSQTLPDQSCSVIFQQSENRLHMQKALLLRLLKK